MQENFKFSRQVLEDHIIETERVFRLGNKSYARWMMNSTMNICMGCHLQTPRESSHFSEFTNTKIFSSDFERAEFLFTTRDFIGANRIYGNLLDTYPHSGVNREQLESAVRRQVGYFARIERNPKAGKEALQKILANKKLPQPLQESIAAWQAQFAKWEKIKIPTPDFENKEQLLSFAEKYLNDDALISDEINHPRLVTDLIISGVLYEYLEKHPYSNKTPEILYWLSVCDRELNNNFFYSLADLYLRECITEFPENPIAKKCFKEYEANVIMGYSGSSGTHVPGDVSADLKRLRDLVNATPKSQEKTSTP